jgi:uncharacterized membrane protein
MTTDTHPEHPVVVRTREKRAADAQLRVADAITAFAGSMTFVYLHVAVFAAWMLFAESSPWPTLTLVVSLEAIFLSTFVMIGQNRAAVFQQAKADHDRGLGPGIVTTSATVGTVLMPRSSRRLLTAIDACGGWGRS